jgi:hypothetical protein
MAPHVAKTQIRPSVAFGSWLCKNASSEVQIQRLLHVFDYALIAAISGWIPMMFITRVRL